MVNDDGFDMDHWDQRCRNWGVFSNIDDGTPSRMGRPATIPSVDDIDAMETDGLMCELKRRGWRGRMMQTLLLYYYTRELYQWTTWNFELDRMMSRGFGRAWTAMQDGMNGPDRASVWLTMALRQLHAVATE